MPAGGNRLRQATDALGYGQRTLLAPFALTVETSMLRFSDNGKALAVVDVVNGCGSSIRAPVWLGRCSSRRVSLCSSLAFDHEAKRLLVAAGTRSTSEPVGERRWEFQLPSTVTAFTSRETARC